MCALLAMCAYCTPENGKEKYLVQTLESLRATVNFDHHRLVVINNGMDVECLHPAEEWFTLLEPGRNLGTAEGINLALRLRELGEPACKMDDDWTTGHVGWVDDMVRVLCEHPEIGILGLKRDDVYGELVEDGELLWNSDIMGTCTMFQPEMLEKVGYMWSPGVYGYDDVTMSVRSECAGFKNAFMKNIRIVNLDEGGTLFTEWKKREAGEHMNEVSIVCDKYMDGTLDVYYNPFE